MSAVTGPVANPSIPNEFPFEILERQYHYRYRHVADLSMHAVLRFNGRIRRELMAKALRLCADVYPILGCYAKERFWDLRWVRRKDLDSLEWCTLEETQEIEQEMQRYLLIPCKPWKRDPLLQGHILRGPDGDVLCLKSNHAVSDAAGFKEVLYTIADLYAKLLKDPSYHPGPKTGFDRSDRQVLQKVSLAKQLILIQKASREKRARKHLSHALGLPFITGGRRQRRFLIYSIPAEKFTRLRDYARSRAASFNDLMNALFGYAILQQYNKGHTAPLIFYNPVDLRKYTPDSLHVEGPRNLSSVTAFSVVPAADPTFDSLLSECQRQFQLVRDSMKGLDGLLEAKLRNLLPNKLLTGIMDRKWQRLASFCRHGGKLSLPIPVSNTGIINHHRLQFPGVDLASVYLIPFTYYHSCYFSSAIFKKQLVISAGICNANTIEPQIRGLFAEIGRQIDRLVQPPLAQAH